MCGNNLELSTFKKEEGHLWGGASDLEEKPGIIRFYKPNEKSISRKTSGYWLSSEGYFLVHRLIVIWWKGLGSSLGSLLVVLVAQSCLTLCDPTDLSPPGFSVHGIIQARILEWIAIPFSRNLLDGWDKIHLWYWVFQLPPKGFLLVLYWLCALVHCRSATVLLGFSRWCEAFF